MGSLKNLVIKTSTVTTPSGEFSVRGLSLNDILRLVQRHGAVMSDLFTKAAESGGELPMDDFALMGAKIVEAAPELAAEVIALAGDSFEEEVISVVRKLPFPAQVQALQAIGELTFTPEFPPKKVAAAVIQMAQGTTAVLADLRQA